MSSIKLKTFGGIVPRVEPKLLLDQAAQTASDLRLVRGRIEPIHEPELVQTVLPGTKTIYLWRRLDATTEWLSWQVNVDVISAPIAEDQYSRIFYTGDGPLKVKGYLGGTVTTKDVTMPIPAALLADPVTDADDPTKWCYYVQTFVDAWGMEGPPSPISNKVAFVEGTEIVLSEFGIAGAGAVKRRFYRSAAGLETDNFYFLAEVSIADDNYHDTVTDSQLAETLPLFENPPTDLQGIILHPNGFAVAFHGREICMTPPYLIHSWPTEYRLTVDYDIVGLAISCGNILVLTKGTPYTVAGSHPELMTVTRLMVNQACVSKKSICQIGNLVCYASPDGLVIAHCGGATALGTEKFYTREQWQALNPSTLVAGVQDGRYIAFNATGGFVFDMNEGIQALTTTSVIGEAVFTDLIDDALYIVCGSELKEWNASVTMLSATWRSKEFASNRRMNWSSFRAIADAYPITLRLYADGVKVEDRTIPSINSVRLKPMAPARIWSIEVAGTSNIDEVMLATSMDDLR